MAPAGFDLAFAGEFVCLAQAVPPGSYIAPSVKIEFGSLTNQRPTGHHPIEPLVVKLAPVAFEDFHAKVVALETKRSFWEKATILHAEHHRPAAQPFRDRFTRHYTNFAALWMYPPAHPARSQIAVLERARIHKSRFFGSSWTNYETARPGSLRLTPPESRLADLRRDCRAMEPMFISAPTTFETLLGILHRPEQSVNAWPAEQHDRPGNTVL